MNWVETNLPLIEVSNAMEIFCEVSHATSEQHADLQKSSFSREASNSELLRQFFDKYDPYPNIDKILSIFSGVVGDKNINCYDLQK